MRYLGDEELVEMMISNGVLHEVNRTFFHPLGLALTLRYYDQNNKSELLLQHTDDPKGVTFDFLDRFKMHSFRELSNEKYALREENLGFVIQIADLTEDDTNYKVIKTYKTERLEILIKHLVSFFYDVQSKFIKHHDKKDDESMGFLQKDSMKEALHIALFKEDWVSVAAWAMIISKYDALEKEIKSIKSGENNA